MRENLTRRVGRRINHLNPEWGMGQVHTLLNNICFIGIVAASLVGQSSGVKADLPIHSSALPPAIVSPGTTHLNVPNKALFWQKQGYAFEMVRDFMASYKVGNTVSVRGDVTVINALEEKRKASPLLDIHLGDRLKTGNKSYARKNFVDDSFIKLGSNTDCTILNYFFNEKTKAYISEILLEKGLFSFLAGKIGGIAPQNYKIYTANATIGIRGSGGEIITDDGETTGRVFTLVRTMEGHVLSVKTDFGEFILDDAQRGVLVTSDGVEWIEVDESPWMREHDIPALETGPPGNKAMSANSGRMGNYLEKIIIEHLLSYAGKGAVFREVYQYRSKAQGEDKHFHDSVIAFANRLEEYEAKIFPVEMDNSQSRSAGNGIMGIIAQSIALESDVINEVAKLQERHPILSAGQGDIPSENGQEISLFQWNALQEEAPIFQEPSIIDGIPLENWFEGYDYTNVGRMKAHKWAVIEAADDRALAEVAWYSGINPMPFTKSKDDHHKRAATSSSKKKGLRSKSGLGKNLRL